MTLRKTNEQLADDYDEMLRDCYSEHGNGLISICGLQYDLVETFKEIDPIAYRCGFTDYLDSLEDEDF